MYRIRLRRRGRCRCRIRLISMGVVYGSFLNAIDKYLDAGYVPSDEGFRGTDVDILMVRAVTMAISDNLFEVEGKKLHFFDVSGLSYHRRGSRDLILAWLPYFMDVHSVLFVASLSSYDRVMVEDKTKNQMTDSLVLFETIANHPLLKSIEFILFLNKRFNLWINVRDL